MDEILQQLKSGNAPGELKRSIAQGIIPLESKDLIDALIQLCTDKDSAIRGEAVKSLKKIPLNIVLGVCESTGTDPSLLDKLARIFKKKEEILEKIILNPAAADQTVAFAAALPFPGILEIIGRNQARLERSEEVRKSLGENRALSPAVLSLLEESDRRRREAVARARIADEGEIEEEERALPALLVGELEDAGKVGQPEPAAIEEKKKTIHQMLKEMSAGHKVALAAKGNSEVRKILVREKNRLVCSKVLENPRITDSEVESYARSTNVSEDVLRAIANNKEWARQPSLVRALVNNPKTPLGQTLTFVKRLPKRDLEGLSKNRNVPEALRNTARKLFKMKKENK